MPKVLSSAHVDPIMSFKTLSGESAHLPGLAAAVPLELVGFTVPGVLVGGQLAPLLAGRAPEALVRRAAAGVFGVVGLAFAVKAAVG